MEGGETDYKELPGLLEMFCILSGHCLHMHIYQNSSNSHLSLCILLNISSTFKKDDKSLMLFCSSENPPLDSLMAFLMDRVQLWLTDS